MLLTLARLGSAADAARVEVRIERDGMVHWFFAADSETKTLQLDSRQNPWPVSGVLSIDAHAQFADKSDLAFAGLLQLDAHNPGQVVLPLYPWSLSDDQGRRLAQNVEIALPPGLTANEVRVRGGRPGPLTARSDRLVIPMRFEIDTPADERIEIVLPRSAFDPTAGFSDAPMEQNSPKTMEIALLVVGGLILSAAIRRAIHRMVQGKSGANR
ncbi:hypothetical protein KDL45_02555 [bacterium]|nr:hypothetical protein [bacterium]